MQHPLPPLEIVAHHITHLYQSLLQYKAHYQDAITKAYGGNMPENHISYLCPLCLQSLLDISDKGVGVNAEFDLDHYPPESVGGKNSVMVCKRCNSRAGHEFEAVLIKELNHRSYRLKIPGAKIETKLLVKGVTGRYGATFKMSPDGAHIVDFGKLGKKQFITDWLKKIQTGREEWKIQAEIAHDHELRLRKSLLKAAFLYCFTLFGYEFAFSSAAENMRQCIFSDMEFPIKQGYIYWFENDATLKLPQGVCFIDSPENLKNYVVNVPMIINNPDYKCIAGVPIANPTPEGWKDLSKFLVPSNTEIKIRELHHYDINQKLKGYSTDWNNIAAGKIIQVD